MKIVVIFMWFAFTFSKNIILIGDTRTYLMAANLFGFPLTPKSIIKNENPFRYRGHNIYVIAKKGASAMNFATSSGDLYTETHERIRKISSGSSETLVFLCLGINSIRNIMGTSKLYIGFANAHKRAKFYAISMAGVNEDIIKNRYDIKNNQISTFNKKLS